MLMCSWWGSKLCHLISNESQAWILEHRTASIQEAYATLYSRRTRRLMYVKARTSTKYYHLIALIYACDLFPIFEKHNNSMVVQ